jgi:hypothetical protein
MKKALLLAALVFAAGNAFAGNADFTLVNKTGYPIDKVYLSPSNEDHWGPDQLGDDQLNNGASKEFAFADSAHCAQDLKVVYEDKSSHQWTNVDLCKIDKITLHYNESTDSTSITTE